MLLRFRYSKIGRVFWINYAVHTSFGQVIEQLSSLSKFRTKIAKCLNFQAGEVYRTQLNPKDLAEGFPMRIYYSLAKSASIQPSSSPPKSYFSIFSSSRVWNTKNMSASWYRGLDWNWRLKCMLQRQTRKEIPLLPFTLTPASTQNVRPRGRASVSHRLVPVEARICQN